MFLDKLRFSNELFSLSVRRQQTTVLKETLFVQTLLDLLFYIYWVIPRKIFKRFENLVEITDKDNFVFVNL